VGVEYSRYLIPQPASYAPSCATVCQLLAVFVENRWLPHAGSESLRSIRYRVPDESAKEFYDPGTRFPWTLLPWIQKKEPSRSFLQLPEYRDCPAQVDEEFLQAQYDNGGLLLEYSLWHLDLDDLVYPLERLDYERDNVYYELRFWLSPDFVYVTSECLEGFENSRCECGHQLAHEKPRDVFTTSHFPLNCPICEKPFNPSEYLFRVYNGFNGEQSVVPGGTTFRFAIEMDCGKCMPESSVEFAPRFRTLCGEVLQCDFVELEDVN
jgi:hypothetical protein